MKISKQELQKIIAEETEKLYSEELQKMLQEGEIDEGIIDRTMAKIKGAGTSVGGAFKGALSRGIGGVAGRTGLSDVAASAATQTQKIKSQTQAKKDAINLEQVIIPKVDNLVGDLQKLFAGREKEKFYEDIMTSVKDLRLRVKEMQEKIATSAPTNSSSQTVTKPAEPSRLVSASPEDIKKYGE